MAGFNDLGLPAKAVAIQSETAANISAYFLPTRMGTYEVTMFANDGCNTPQFDSVSVTTNCLTMTATSTAVAPVAGSPQSGTVQVNGTYGGVANNNLNWALRVTSRTPLTYGDKFPAGFITVTPAPGQTAVSSAECLLSPTFTTVADQAGYTFPPSPISVTYATRGTYQVSSFLVDGCTSTSVALPQVVITCASTITGFTASNTSLVAVWNTNAYVLDSGFIPTVSNGGASATYSWYLTASPANAGTGTVAQYPSNAATMSNLDPTTVQCTNTAPWSVGGLLRQVDPSGGPMGLSPVGSGNTLPSALQSVRGFALVFSRVSPSPG
jgi:hypothetical protein